MSTGGPHPCPEHLTYCQGENSLDELSPYALGARHRFLRTSEALWMYCQEFGDLMSDFRPLEVITVGLRKICKHQNFHYPHCGWCGARARHRPASPTHIGPHPLAEDPMGVCTWCMPHSADHKGEPLLRAIWFFWCVACAPLPSPLPSGLALDCGRHSVIGARVGHTNAKPAEATLGTPDAGIASAVVVPIALAWYRGPKSPMAPAPPAPPRRA